MEKNKLIISIILIIIISAIMVVGFTIDKDNRLDVLTIKNKNIHQGQINAILNQYKSSNKFIFSSIINDNDILKLQRDALKTKDKKQQNKYRKELYNKLLNLYKNLKDYGVKQLHFHLPDNTSFLRFHKPNKFGDSLKDIRYSVVAVNKEKKPIYGFEEGRIFNGYRIVYPLFYNKEHIGSVEISIGFDAINKISINNYNTYQYMILNKDIIEDKLFTNEKQNYEVSNLNKYFYHEINGFSNYKNMFLKQNNLIDYKTFNKINKTLSKTIKQKELLKYKHILKFVKIDSGYYYISLLPIKNIENKNIGYIISYEICDCVDGIIKEYYIKLFISFLLFSFLLLFVYINNRSNIKLKKINKISNEQRDKAIKATKAKSEFLANMSHEIRTPLNAILGFIEILKDEIDDEKLKSHLTTIDNSSKNLLKIIEDILDFSKIESGKLDIDKVDFNSKAEFEVITHLFSARCLEKNISLNLNIDKNLPQIINTDPFRIKQVITNLMSNAIKFTDNGKSITIDIRYINSLLFISIKDEGIGIDENKYIDIFKAFTQEDTSTTRQYGGTGLGLSISNELIKLLGGELKVKSEVGVGSEFYFYIPITIGKDLKIDNFISKNIDLSNKKIILVEDNKANQMFMKVVLKKMNFTFDIANDGIEAVEMYPKNKYDAILMDENMPNMNGIEATKEILKLEKENNLKHTPIIALTANALKGDRERFLEAGMDEYLTKPVNQKKLAEILNSIPFNRKI